MPLYVSGEMMCIIQQMLLVQLVICRKQNLISCSWNTLRISIKYVNIKSKTKIFRRYIHLCPISSKYILQRKFCTCFQEVQECLFAHAFKRCKNVYYSIICNNKKLETLFGSSCQMYES